MGSEGEERGRGTEGTLCVGGSQTARLCATEICGEDGLCARRSGRPVSVYKGEGGSSSNSRGLNGFHVDRKSTESQEGGEMEAWV